VITGMPTLRFCPSSISIGLETGSGEREPMCVEKRTSMQ
jgi:hypothetical protein